MLIKYCTKTILFLSLLGVVLTGENSAQTGEFCGLKIKPVLSMNDTYIKGVTVTATDLEIKRVYRSVLKDGLPYLAKLPEAEYKITLSKPGFNRTVHNYVLTCAQMDNDEAVATSIPMWKGSAKQTIQSARVRPTGKFMIGHEDMGVSAPTVSPRPASGPVSTGMSIKEDSKTVSKGVLNGSAISLPKPAYPPAARAVGASGAVNVQVTIDEDGNVISATAISGHPLLRSVSADAARLSKFKPTLLMGHPVKVSGIIVYNFQ